MANTHSATFVAASSQGKKTSTNFTSYGTAAVTAECWVKTSTDNGTSIVLAVNDGSTETFQLYKIASDNGYKFAIRAGGSFYASDIIPEASIEDGDWHHLAGVYDGSNIHIYLDGSEYGTANAATGNLNTSNPAPFCMAYRASGPDLFWDGQIDDVRVWDDARSEAEIDDNKSIELTGSEANLALYAKFNNNNTDETGNYTISNQGVPTFTTDVPQFSILGSFTADAVLKETQASSFTADAYLCHTLTADAVLKETQTGSLTADAVLKQTQADSLTADAYLSESFTADAVLKGTIAGSLTADAVLKETQSSSFTADSVLLETTSDTFTANAVLKGTISDSFTADACLTSAAVSPEQYLFTQAGPIYLPLFPLPPVSVSVTTDHTADYRSVILCNATSGSLTVTLPEVADNLDKCYTIKHTSGSHPVVVQGNIDADASRTLSEYDVLRVVGSSQWWEV